MLKRTKQVTIWAQDSEHDTSRQEIIIAPQAKIAWLDAGDDSGTIFPYGQSAYELLQSLLASEKADRRRMYLTGLSMGENGRADFRACYEL